MRLRIFTFFTILLFSGSMITRATTLIVDSHFPRPVGVFATIQLAYNAASPGDTILISPAIGEYAGIALAKRVHIVGTGWSDASTSVLHTKTTGFVFNAGSQGSSITGLDISSGFDIYTDSITVKRNKFHYVYVRANCTNIVIMQNFIISYRESTGDWSASTMIPIYENTEVLISNNIIYNRRTGSYGQYAIYAQYPTNVIVCNNVLNGEDGAIILAMSGGNYSTHRVFNNIVLSGAASGVAVTYDENNHNMANSTQFGIINNNQQNVTMADVFVNTTTDDYHLKSASLAIGAGLDGTDCGIYGGLYPFVDNGRTWLPVITEVSVPALVNVKDGLNVTVKAKSGK